MTFINDSSHGKDLIGRDRFVTAFSDAISNWKDNSTLTIGIIGDWGSGKTFTKNLIVKELKNKHSECEIIEFNPWEWSAQDKVFPAFFDEISKGLSHNKIHKKIAKQFVKYGSILGKAIDRAEYIFKEFKKITVTLGSVLLLLGVNDILPNIGDYKSGATKIIIAFFAFFFSWKNFFTGYNERFSKITIEEQKEKIKSVCSELPRPIVVIVDDIDRLTPIEIKAIFQLVKINSDFPNFIFILLFDQKHINESLQKIEIARPEKYLQKIVQLPIHLPNTDEETLESIFLTHLDGVLKEHELESKLEAESRWGITYQLAINTLFRTIREIKLFRNGLKFTISQLVQSSDKKLYDYNVLDLIALEMIKTVEPTLYSQIPLFRYELTGQRKRNYIEIESNKERKNDALQGLLSQICEVKNKEIIVRMLKDLFPYAENALGGAYTHEINDQWAAENRVAHCDYFDQYFSFTLKKWQVSESIIEDWLGSAITPKEFIHFYDDLKEKELHTHAVHRLYLNATEKEVFDKPERTKNIIYSLMVIAEGIRDWGHVISVTRLAEFLVQKGLNGLPTIDRLPFLEAIKYTDCGFYVICSLCSRAKKDSDVRTLLEDTDWALLREKVKEQLRDIDCSNQKFYGSPHFGIVLSYWYNEDMEQARKYAAELIKSGTVIPLLHAVKNIGSGSRGNNISILMCKIERYVDKNEVEAVVNLLDLSTLEKEDKWVVEAFKRSLAFPDQPTDDRTFPPDEIRVFESEVEV